MPGSLRTLPTVLGGALINPDSYMRLVRLRDGLAVGHVGHVVAADGSGAGTVLHWSHLLDTLLVLLAVPLRPWLDWSAALFVAAALLGPLSVWVLGAALAWAVAPVAAPRFLWAAPLAAGLSAPVLAYGATGVAHHHVLLLAAAVFVCGACGRAARGDRLAGWRAGLAAAVAIWLTPETLPALAAGFFLPLLAWLRRPGDARRGRGIADAMALGAAAFALVTACAWIVDPPMQRWAADIDRVSVVYVALGGAVAVAGGAFGVAARLPVGPGWRAIAALAPATAALPLWAAAFPAVLRGPGGLMESATAHAFFAGIAEMRPVEGVGEAALYLWPGMAATALAAALGWRGRDPAWAWATWVAAVAVGLAAWHVRFAGFPAMCAAAALPVALTRASALRPASRRAPARVGAFAVVLLLPILPALAGALPDHPAYACPVRAALPLLAAHPGAVVLSSVNEVPELLWRTRVRTVGSLYHRNAAAFLRLRAAWRSGTDGTSVPDAVRATGAQYVLICPALSGPAAGADTLWDRLRRDDPPPWLSPAGVGRPAPGIAAPRLWRVRPDR